MRATRHAKWPLQNAWKCILQKGKTRKDDFKGKKERKRERAVLREMKALAMEIIENSKG
jgi:hypothetical protein